MCFCSLAQGFKSWSDFAEHLAVSVDIVFPVIHGQFGEDGGIQVLYSTTFTTMTTHIFEILVLFSFSLLCIFSNVMFQEVLEKYNIPFVGTGSNECRQAFDKV